MGKIKILSPEVAGAIAAGEIVERPASVVRELCDNALDAGADIITIEIEQGGIRCIKVTDNGSGMSADDALLAFQEHATSKISTLNDLEMIESRGFRGEALPSIAAVAKVTLETRRNDDDRGTRVRIEGGTLQEHLPVGTSVGTTVTVENLFYNVPARYKYLRKDTTEAARILDAVQKLACARPDVSFRLLNNGRESLHTPGNNDPASVVRVVWGKELADSCRIIPDNEAIHSPVWISGVIGSPDKTRAGRNWQWVYVNERPIKAPIVNAAIDRASQGWVMKGQYLPMMLFISLPPNLLDVNVHPQKLEVRFWDEQKIFSAVYHTIEAHLQRLSAERKLASEGTAQPVVSVLPPEQPDVVIHQPDGDSGGSERSISILAPPYSADIYDPASLYISHEGTPVRHGVPKTQISDQVEPKPETTGKANIFTEIGRRGRYVGQLFDTYILMELDTNIYLIDQHAAHEKIIFERLLTRQSEAGEVEEAASVQPLLIPLRLDLAPMELSAVRENGEFLAELGFDFDFFGERTVVLRGIPDSPDMISPEIAFRAAIAACSDTNYPLGEGIQTWLEQRKIQATADIACKAAIKANYGLDHRSVLSLLEQLENLNDPFHCPHGRPTIVEISKAELEKRFGRIV
ncbi:MAG: DNA mismatch repair endonuclease MutL [Clostridiaceae bacterium]|nr:DNA mismatch repair endonuclease MutL [Clostridiaceae bacterium]